MYIHQMWLVDPGGLLTDLHGPAIHGDVGRFSATTGRSLINGMGLLIPPTELWCVWTSTGWTNQTVSKIIGVREIASLEGDNVMLIGALISMYLIPVACSWRVMAHLLLHPDLKIWTRYSLYNGM